MPLFLLQPTSYDAVATATIVIAIATVAYFFTTLVLVWLTKRNVDLTKRMFEASHRPYVAFSDWSRELTQTPQSLALHLLVKNVGSVPAFDLAVNTYFVVDGHVLPNVERDEKVSSVLFPGVPEQAGVQTEGEAEFKKVSEASSLVISVKCSYRGAAKEAYITEGKFEYIKERNTFRIAKTTAT